MSDDIDVMDEYEVNGMKVQVAKSLVIIARTKNKIIAMKPVLHYFHAQNTVEKLQNDAAYRKNFIEKYSLKTKKTK